MNYQFWIRSTFVAIVLIVSAAWQGEVFHEDLLNAWRIYPNRLNTVGFFLAKIAPR